MNDFFKTNTTDTINVNGNPLTAMDIAKIAGLGNSRIAWCGSDTYISANKISNTLADFFTDNDADREQLADDLFMTVSWSYNGKNERFEEQSAKVMRDAQSIILDWATARLYTCLKKGVVSESRFINLDKLEAMLDVKLGDSVRERLSYVEVQKDVDGDWVFDSATGRSYRENATVGILTEIADAVNLVESATKEALHFVRRGVTDFEEICNESYALNIDRMPAGDIEDIKQAIADSGVTPQEYTAYFSQSYNECQIAMSESVKGRWDYNEGCELKTFATYAEADKFREDFAKSYGVQKKRVKLTKELQAHQAHLDDLKSQLEALNA